MQTLDQIVEDLFNKFTFQKPIPCPTPIKPQRAYSAFRRKPQNPQQILQQATQIVERKQALLNSIQSMKLQRSYTVCKTEESNKPVKFERYQILSKLAVGAFATVFKAYDRMTDSQVKITNTIVQVAIKKYNSNLLKSEQKKLLSKETEILKKLDHENIVKFLGTYKNTIVLEFIDGHTLTNYLKNQPNRRLQEKEAKQIYSQIRDGIKYLHSKNIFHRDLKADNIMIINQQVKLIDFGLASENQLCSDFCGTPAYMAPEIFQKKPYDGRKADIWALGVLLYQILCGKVPFPGKNDEEIMLAQLPKFSLPKKISKEFQYQLLHLLDKDHTKRKL
ncbi:unnamed protein product (macronuclear) [Paramecium tetraurelia]|uniref:Protein kinase domain-containing protein n=1 Tax=Paramecium tetraurelia TaxID=5888 RepID=A0CYL8_PARTE|nr:uncharacterized protein GSPATT00011486001 [Paramecium tetraurelia]CAK75885.1 unnamed protein product [Paramecium tetraurelia]|eukprot:XP_001443282.1 hypothetical protein (macronuclear) [Paramecium tetraurelia strain d4-2]